MVIARRVSLSATPTMLNSRKRKLSFTVEGPVAKQSRDDAPIIISDDSDDEIRHISPPRLTSKQKGKARALLETDDSPPLLRDIDVISIPDDEEPIIPAVPRHQTPLEISDHQLDPVEGTPDEFEASNEMRPPDRILEQFRNIFFGERKCSQCERPIQPVRSPVCSLPPVLDMRLT